MFSGAKNVIHKVPATDSEALKSPLLGLFEKKRLRNFYIYLDKVDETKKETWGDVDLMNQNMDVLFKKYSLEDNTVDFLGHAVALHTNDDYRLRPSIDTVQKMQLYVESLGKYGNSPFLYPVYGLGGLPESFSRLCAIHGGTYMLNKPVDEVLFNEEGAVCGIRSGDETARAPLIICDPSYVAGLKKTKEVGKVIRAICIMDHPIPNTNNSTSI
jgi:Rab GDP dissociation inhibitor